MPSLHSQYEVMSLWNFSNESILYLDMWNQVLEKKIVDFYYKKCYIIDKESTHSKVDAPQARLCALTDTAYPVDQTG